MYLYVNSSPSAYYPENTAADFTVQLPKTVEDVAECGVIELRLASIPLEAAFLCTDICQGSLINTHTLPILRRVVQKVSSPSHIAYIPLRVTSLETIRFFICGENGQPIQLSGQTSLTLHLR